MPILEWDHVPIQSLSIHQKFHNNIFPFVDDENTIAKGDSNLFQLHNISLLPSFNQSYYNKLPPFN